MDSASLCEIPEMLYMPGDVVLIKRISFSPFLPSPPLCPPILAFVKGEGAGKFPSLQVRYKKGASPTLKLLDDTNTVQDTLA